MHLSEQAAYLRIQAARVSRCCPRVLEALARGELSLSAVKLLDRYLTPESEAELIHAATHKTVRELELLLAERFPRPDVPTRLRKLPEPRVPAAVGGAPRTAMLPDAMHPASQQVSSKPVEAECGCACSTPPPGGGRARTTARVVPLAPARYKLELTVSEATRDKLRRAQELLRHAVPSGDVEQILSRALDLLIEKTEARRFGTPRKRSRKAQPATGRGSVRTELGAALGSPADQPLGAEAPEPLAPLDAAPATDPAREPLAANDRAAEAAAKSRRSRHLPAAVRRAVYERDGARCAYVSPDGRRCAARDELEFHHLTPYAHGGPPTVDNVEVRCRGHNLDQAERDFGRAHVERAISRARSLRRPPQRGRARNHPSAACGVVDRP